MNVSDLVSQYDSTSIDEWHFITEQLNQLFPIPMDQICTAVLESWNDIFTISNASHDFEIGENIFPKPQILGFFLETLINRKLCRLAPDVWVPDPTGYSKDLVNLKNPEFSLEIKTSSNKSRIYGNRSYGIDSENGKKGKSSYYLAVNFEKFTSTTQKPHIQLIRFGYLTFSDWKSQVASSGQAAHIPVQIERAKLLTIWEPGKE